jgi:hypothetical protein
MNYKTNVTLLIVVSIVLNSQYTHMFRNIEDIYDKDILRLQNFQNLVAGDINKIKLDLTGNPNISCTILCKQLLKKSKLVSVKKLNNVTKQRQCLKVLWKTGV